MKNLRDFTYAELLREVASLGERPYRAEQIFRWVYARRAIEISAMTDISAKFRERLSLDYGIKGLDTADSLAAPDGTRKFVSRLSDGETIESVLIPEPERLTLCVSTQAGCALKCAFCMTGTMGLARNLELYELNGQVFRALEIIGAERLTNIVLMGMGEPLNNYDNVVRFLSVLTHGKGFAFSHNKITVSTAGYVPGIERLGADTEVNLAVSLNATTDDVRDRLMPINRKYPIKVLLDALRRYPLKHRKYITIEYVLVKGVNDTDEDARRLVRMLRGIQVKINLIPLNPFAGSGLERPSEERVDAFHRIVLGSGLVVITRLSRGAEIQAACGQLKGGKAGV